VGVLDVDKGAVMDAVAWLRDRADSYEADRMVLWSLGWSAEVSMFGVVREELRRCADELEARTRAGA
jgi:hypothetical protein